MAEQKKKQKPKYSVMNNISFMVKRAWNGHRAVLAVCLFIALSTFGKTVTEMLIAPMILQVVESGGSLTTLITRVLVFTFLMVLFSGVLEYMNDNSLFGRVTIRSGIISDLEEKRSITSYPNLYDTKFIESSKQAYDACGTNQKATEAIWKTLESLLANTLGLVFYLILISGLDIRLAGMITVITMISFFYNSKLGEWQFNHKEEKAEIMNKLQYSTDVLLEREYAKEIRIFGITDWANDLWEKSLRLYIDFVAGCHKRLLMGNIFDIVLTFLKNGISYYVLLAIFFAGKITVAEFLLYFAAVSGYSAWVGGILNNLLILHKQSLEISTLREFLDWNEPFKFEGGKSLPKAPFVFELKDVSYRYPEAEKDTIKNINLRINPGEKIAIVGLNGAGKTTLIRLLSGFLDPTKGQVLLNGIDIREFNRREYYDIFSAVFQEFSVLPATIRENVTQDISEFDRSKLEKCLTQADLKKKIDSLPKGIDTQITRSVYEDGLELSGGETQRLMLARVLYKDSPVVLLDEPTAALDPIAENNIYLRYNEMTKGKQSVFISHRLASTRFCDRILFLEDGKIVEEGTHDMLMRAGGKYADIYEVQSKYYKEDGDNEESDFNENGNIA